MIRKKLISYLCVVLLISNGVLLFLFLQRPKHEGPKKEIIAKLAFDEKQVQAYEKTILKHRTQIKKKNKEIVVLKNMLYKKLILDIEKSEQDSLIALLGQKQVEIEHIHYNHFLEIKKICTKPEQIKKFKDLTAELGRLFDKKPHHPKK